MMNLPAHSKGLGHPVAARPYGLPSEFEKNLQRRESPGLTRVGAASVSFCPLQALFGIITPSGLHFERHHQGWWDIDPAKHCLMINGSNHSMLKRPMVLDMDEIMRLPSVSRMCFIECGANSAIEWNNTAVTGRAVDDTGHIQPTVQALRAVRGARSIHHNNAVQSWHLTENGEVKNVQVG